MTLVLITDIFGLNQELQEVTHWLMNTTEMPVKTIDPYQGQQLNFLDEEQAYQHFIKKCGHDQYLNIINQSLSNVQQDVIIIGFSAGASAAWRYISRDYSSTKQPQPLGVKHFIGFYPSQIRHHTHLTPLCSTTLLFPVKEPHFDVKNVIHELTNNSPVNCITTEYYHGFMNPNSAHYSAKANLYYRQQLSYIHPLINDFRLKELLVE